MERRDFLVAGAGFAAAAGIARAQGQSEQGQSPAGASSRSGKDFALDYAPHFGMFQATAGGDVLDQLRFMRDQGFRSLEDNGMAHRSKEDQERIAREMDRLGMRMGVFVVNFDTSFGKRSFGSNDKGMRDRFLEECRHAVEVAKRVNAKWMTVVPGERDGRLPLEYQTAYAVDQLRRGAEIFEPHGLVMVLEPLNPYRDHPNMLLATTPHAYEICRAVNSPSCKILYDIYHQQITEGNLIPNIDRAWDEIAYLQVGDNPGRNEPTTGEINYANVFAHVKRKGFDGILGMEHGNSRPGTEGEQAVIDAYRACDPA